MAVSVVPHLRRPYPVVFLVDTSGSMADDGKISVLNESLRGALGLLASIDDPDLELWCAVISFGAEAETLAGFAPVERISPPVLTAGGGTVFGGALHKLAEVFDGANMPAVPHPPAIVLISDGQPTDDYETVLRGLLAEEWFRLSLRIAIRIGPDCDEAHLRVFTGAASSVLSVSELMTLPDVMVRSARVIQNDLRTSSSSHVAGE